MESLLNALRVTIRTHKGIEDGQDVTAVIHHARENIAKLRIASRVAVPLRENHGRDFDVPPQLVRGVPAQEQAVEKGRLALREVEIMHDFGRNELWHRRHRENAVYRKVSPRQVGLLFSCRVRGTSPSSRVSVPSPFAQPVQRRGCQTVLTALGCL